MTEPAAPGEDELFNPELATPAWRRRLKASDTGRLAAMLYRRRRVPAQLLRAPGGLRGKPLPAPDPAARRRVRCVVWVPAGPGALDGVLAAWESVQASSPGEVALLVTDDWSPDAHADAITAHIPEALVVRPRFPSGGPPRLWPVTALAVATALRHFDFDLLVKFDADALVTGPGVVDALVSAIASAQSDAVAVGAEDAGTPAAALASAVPVGIGGAFITRPDGAEETDRDYHRRVLDGEVPHDDQLAAWERAARESGWPPGAIVQGSCVVMTRAYCAALADAGALTYRQRLRTIVSEDLLLTMLAYALGFRAASFGGPRGPLAIANKHLPLPLDELVDPESPWLVAHSTRVGLDGESENEVRRRASLARERWPQPTAAR
ncbi:MAG: hypothetical protein J7513_06210 [Solirubrobacteraceae bacterium]|nr:hypothetical protein [Solirubrobacteraceae bacterium]